MSRPFPAADLRRVLEHQLRTDGSRPLVTFYDDATGERVELSVVTYANWVAKTAGLLEDELMVERGGTVLVDLPTHWLGPVWLGALWSIGAVVTDDRSRVGQVDLVVCGPEDVADARRHRRARGGAVAAPHGRSVPSTAAGPAGRGRRLR